MQQGFSSKQTTAQGVSALRIHGRCGEATVDRMEGKRSKTACVFVKDIFPPKPSPNLTSDSVLNPVPGVRTPLQLTDRPTGEFALLEK